MFSIIRWVLLSENHVATYNHFGDTYMVFSLGGRVVFVEPRLYSYGGHYKSTPIAVRITSNPEKFLRGERDVFGADTIYDQPGWVCTTTEVK